MIEISVVIPNYNGEKYLKACIDSVLKQKGISFEIIIIDNDSKDSSYKCLAGYSEIIYKQLDKNYGFSKAVNEGIKLAQGEYVLLLNNDTVLEKDFLREMLKSIQKDNDVFGVSSKMISYQNHEVMDDAGDEYTLLGWTLKRGDGKSVERYTKPKNVFSVCAGAALYRKAVFEKIGFFDEAFFAYVEDVDICYRARIYGYKNIYCPEAKVYHIGSATSGSRYNPFKVKLAARNNIYLVYKNMPLVQIIINMPFLIVGWLIKYLFFLHKGLGKHYKEGSLEALQTLNKIEKVKFKWSNLGHYMSIEGLLIKNLWEYIRKDTLE